MAKLTPKTRAKLPTKAFAIKPGSKAAPKGATKGKYPIHDRAHAANALSRVSAHGKPAEKAAVRAAVKQKFPSMPSVKKATPVRPGTTKAVVGGGRRMPVSSRVKLRAQSKKKG